MRIVEAAVEPGGSSAGRRCHQARRRPAALVAAAVMLAAVAGCTKDGGPGPETPVPVSPAPSMVRLGPEPEVLATGLDAPWSIAFHEDIPLVSERDSARVLELDADGNARGIGTIEAAAGRGEGGLLGIAVNAGYLYTYFTAGGENRIERRRITGEPGGLRLEETETILEGIPAGPVHNGGRLAFGPDGMLYATTGDAGNRDNAQDRESLSGKILRMTPDGTAPRDNPFPGTLVYSYGHRNPQGIAWDSDGVLYASEFGQNTWDELNVIEAGGNYGWPQVEGIAGEEGFIDPVQQWTPEDASPSGIAVAGDFLYVANLRGERLRAVPLGDLGASTEFLAGGYGRLRDVVSAPDGSMWILTNNTDGRGRPGPDDDRILRLETD